MLPIAANCCLLLLIAAYCCLLLSCLVPRLRLRADCVAAGPPPPPPAGPPRATPPQHLACGLLPFKANKALISIRNSWHRRSLLAAPQTRRHCRRSVNCQLSHSHTHTPSPSLSLSLSLSLSHTLPPLALASLRTPGSTALPGRAPRVTRWGRTSFPVCCCALISFTFHCVFTCSRTVFMCSLGRGPRTPRALLGLHPLWSRLQEALAVLE